MLVWWGSVAKRGQKKQAVVLGAHQHTLLLKQQTPASLVGGGGVHDSAARRLKCVWWWGFVVRFGSVWLGAAGVGGAEDTRRPGGPEEKTPQVVQW